MLHRYKQYIKDKIMENDRIDLLKTLKYINNARLILNNLESEIIEASDYSDVKVSTFVADLIAKLQHMGLYEKQ